MMDIKNIELIKKLKALLQENNYDLLNRTLRGDADYYFNPFPSNYAKLAKDIKNVDLKPRTIFELFYLGLTVKIENAQKSISQYLLSSLIDMDLLETVESGVRSKRYVIVSYEDNYFLVDKHPAYPTYNSKYNDVYIGVDSYKLLHNLYARECSDILDLCTGSGVQLIMACKKSKANGVGIEINKTTFPITKFNVILNDMEDRIVIKNNYLYDDVKKEKFDLIYSNPPFIPVPKEIPYPICGDGGEDGLEIVSQIIEGYNEHLKQNGKAMMIGELITTANGIPMVECLKDKLKGKFKVQLILLDKVLLKEQVKIVANLACRLNEKNIDTHYMESIWSDMYKRDNVKEYYSFILKVESSDFKECNVEVLNLAHKWIEDSIPKLMKEFEVKKIDETYSINVNDNIVATTDSEGLRLLKSIDSKVTLEEIAEKKFPENNLNSITNMLRVFENVGLIKRE